MKIYFKAFALLAFLCAVTSLRAQQPQVTNHTQPLAAELTEMDKGKPVVPADPKAGEKK